MPIDFPTSPTLNQTYTFGGRTWSWNGSAWDNITTTFGPQGTSGSQGIQGAQGIQGLTGVQGSAGYVGADGSQGTQGIQGSAGYVGADGSQGIQGIQGVQGLTGVQGITGGTPALTQNPPSSPTVGQTFFDTDDGRYYVWTGTEWFEPYNNLAGQQGLQGIQGTGGPQGIQGTQGIQGLQGVGGQINFPVNSQTSAYELASSDVGKVITITTGGVTVSVSRFSPGDSVVVYNNSGSSQTITQNVGTTLRLAATATTGNRSISSYGVATILCVASETFLVSGPGVA